MVSVRFSVRVSVRMGLLGGLGTLRMLFLGSNTSMVVSLLRLMIFMLSVFRSSRICSGSFLFLIIWIFSLFLVLIV